MTSIELSVGDVQNSKPHLIAQILKDNDKQSHLHKHCFHT